MIKLIAQVLLFALGILIGFIGGLAISKKESPESYPLCISEDCHQKR